MKLQIALDEVDCKQALKMVEKIADIIDIVEIGTPMIIREGMLPVREIKKAFPGVTLLADAKIVDGGAMESKMAFDAGADICTVLAVADDVTLEAVVGVARDYGRKTLADLITVKDVGGRAMELDRLGFDYVSVHTAYDLIRMGTTPLDELAVIAGILKNAGPVVMGGINMANIGRAKEIGAAIAVCGTALMHAPDLRAAVEEMTRAAHGEE